MAVKLGRSTKPNLEVGICGEHGGEPSSVEFCYRVGMDYVSCSPYRVPIARLAAAQAARSLEQASIIRDASGMIGGKSMGGVHSFMAGITVRIPLFDQICPAVGRGSLYRR